MDKQVCGPFTKGEVLTSAEVAKMLANGASADNGSWTALDTGNHSGAVLVCSRLSGDTSSPKLEQRVDQILAVLNAHDDLVATVQQMQAAIERAHAALAAATPLQGHYPEPHRRHNDTKAALELFAAGGFNYQRIADQLTITAAGGTYHGEAIRMAGTFWFLTNEERACLYRWEQGKNDGMDGVTLQYIALCVRDHGQQVPA